MSGRGVIAWGAPVPVTVQFRAPVKVHAALPPAARRPGGPALTVIGSSGPAGAGEALVCRVGGGAEERARWLGPVNHAKP